MINQISKVSRNRAWLGLLDTKREARYFTLLSDNMRKKDLGFSGIISIGAFFTSVLILSELSVNIGAWISVAVTAFAGWGIVLKYSYKSAIASSLSNKCFDLALDWQRLWENIDNLDNDKAISKIEELEKKAFEITECSPRDLGHKEKLNIKSAEYVYATICHEYPNVSL